jgi:hypothetical protein
MYGACHAKWSVPDARRGKHWASHCRRLGAFDASQLEARRILGRGKARSELFPATAAYMQGTSRRHPCNKLLTRDSM